MWKYDRCFNRDLDASRVLKATHLSPTDFESVEEGIRRELAKLGWER